MQKTIFHVFIDSDNLIQSIQQIEQIQNMPNHQLSISKNKLQNTQYIIENLDEKFFNKFKLNIWENFNKFKIKENVTNNNISIDDFVPLQTQTVQLFDYDTCELINNLDLTEACEQEKYIIDFVEFQIEINKKYIIKLNLYDKYNVLIDKDINMILEDTQGFSILRKYDKNKYIIESRFPGRTNLVLDIKEKSKFVNYFYPRIVSIKFTQI